MLLPKEKRLAMKSLHDYTIFLYGHPKIGKSSFASQMDTPLFLATEPGLQALSVYELPTPNWTTFLGACSEIAKGSHPYKTVVIDTVDNLYKCCVEHVLTKEGVQHESDLPYGKGYALVREEFLRPLKKLGMLPYGLVLISHTKQEEVKTRTSVYTRNVPTLPASIREQLLGWVDIIMFADINADGDRVLHIKSDDKYISGDRTASIYGAFDTPVPLEFSKFSKCFYNRKGGK